MIYLLDEIEGYSQNELARMLLKYGLYKEYGITGKPVVRCSKLGKPYLAHYPHIYYNYSHCKQGIFCGIHTAEIGVDIERIIPYKERLAKRICHPNELKVLAETSEKEKIMTRIWTAKESYLKYLGIGIRCDMRQVDLSGCVLDRFEKDDCLMRVELKDQYGLAVCTRNKEMEIKKVTRRELEAIILDGSLKELRQNDVAREQTRSEK